MQVKQTMPADRRWSCWPDWSVFSLLGGSVAFVRQQAVDREQCVSTHLAAVRYMRSCSSSTPSLGTGLHTCAGRRGHTITNDRYASTTPPRDTTNTHQVRMAVPIIIFSGSGQGSFAATVAFGFHGNEVGDDSLQVEEEDTVVNDNATQYTVAGHSCDMINRPVMKSLAALLRPSINSTIFPLAQQVRVLIAEL